LNQDNSSSDFEKRLMIKKLGAVENLPMPSIRMMKIVSLLKGLTDVSRLARAIERNPALVVRIMDSVKTDGYAVKSKINSIEDAVQLLGILNIKQIIYSTTFMPLFHPHEGEEWKHAYSSSVLMVNIMQKRKVPASSRLPLMMLLHDIGKLVLKRFNMRKYRTVIEMAAQGMPLFEAEESVFHINHAVASGVLLKKWGIADEVIVPIIHHHSSSVSKIMHYFDTAMIQFVDWIDQSARGWPCVPPCVPPSHELLKATGLDRLDSEYWIEYQKTAIEVIENKKSESEKILKNKVQESNPKHNLKPRLNIGQIVIPVGLSEKYKPELLSTKTTAIKRPLKNIGKDNAIAEIRTHRFKRPVKSLKDDQTQTQTFKRPIKSLKPGVQETQTFKRPIKRLKLSIQDTQTFKRSKR